MRRPTDRVALEVFIAVPGKVVRDTEQLRWQRRFLFRKLPGITLELLYQLFMLCTNRWAFSSRNKLTRTG